MRNQRSSLRSDGAQLIPRQMKAQISVLGRKIHLEVLASERSGPCRLLHDGRIKQFTSRSREQRSVNAKCALPASSGLSCHSHPRIVTANTLLAHSNTGDEDTLLARTRRLRRILLLSQSSRFELSRDPFPALAGERRSISACPLTICFSGFPVLWKRRVMAIREETSQCGARGDSAIQPESMFSL
jgi:hypothetical protein